MNSVMEFLAENYLYVALGSLVIIIILILIIIITNKRAKKKEIEETVDIGEIKTGSIDDVAVNMNTTNDDNLQPQSIGELTQSIPVVNNSEVVSEEAPEVSPIVEEPKPVESAPEVTPVVEEPKPVEAVPEVTPVAEEPKPVEAVPEVAPVAEKPKPVEVVPEVAPVVEEPKPVEAVPEVAPIVEEPKPVEQDVEIPVINSNPEEPKVAEEPKEELEVFGVENDAPKGSAVSGFSSVNVEK